MIGDKVPRDWGVNAQESEICNAAPCPSRWRIKHGVILSFLQLPGGNKAGTLVGEIHASGSGKVSLHTSTCLRPPGCKEKGFSHSIKKEIGSFDLTPERSVFMFTVAVDPYEQGYLYIGVDGEAFISHVSGVLVEKP